MEDAGEPIIAFELAGLSFGWDFSSICAATHRFVL